MLPTILGSITLFANGRPEKVSRFTCVHAQCFATTEDSNSNIPLPGRDACFPMRSRTIRGAGTCRKGGDHRSRKRYLSKNARRDTLPGAGEYEAARELLVQIAKRDETPMQE